MSVSSHKNLILWQRSMALVTTIYSLTKTFPKEETYSLASQIRRAAVSIPSNLAEGHAMQSTAHYLKFIFTARGSLAELETQLMISQNLNYLTKTEVTPVLSEVEELGKMCAKLIFSLRKKMELGAIDLDSSDSLSSEPLVSNDA